MRAIRLTGVFSPSKAFFCVRDPPATGRNAPQKSANLPRPVDPAFSGGTAQESLPTRAVGNLPPVRFPFGLPTGKSPEPGLIGPGNSPS
jgi:hypothetical protein